MSLVLGIILIVIIYIIFSNGKKATKKQKPLKAAVAAGVAAGAVMPRFQVEEDSDDYNDYLLNSSIEQGVVDSHNQFVNDIKHTTTGASAQTVFSEEPDLVPWVGLRRPAYDKVYVDPNSRQVPSIYQSQLPSSNQYSKCGLF